MIDGIFASTHAACDGRAVTKRRDTQADAEAGIGLLAVVVAGVLQGLDVEVASDIHVYGVARELGADQGGVTAATCCQRVAGDAAPVRWLAIFVLFSLAVLSSPWFDRS